MEKTAQVDKKLTFKERYRMRRTDGRRGQGDKPMLVIGQHTYPDWPTKAVSKKATLKNTKRARKAAWDRPQLSSPSKMGPVSAIYMTKEAAKARIHPYPPDQTNKMRFKSRQLYAQKKQEFMVEHMPKKTFKVDAHKQGGAVINMKSFDTMKEARAYIATRKSIDGSIYKVKTERNETDAKS